MDDEDGLTERLLSIAAAALAAKLAMVALEAIWTKGLGKDLPGNDSDSTLSKVVWIGLAAAAVGMARELAQQLIRGKFTERADNPS